MVRLQLKAKKVYVGLERAAKEVNFQINENKIKVMLQTRRKVQAKI